MKRKFKLWLIDIGFNQWLFNKLYKKTTVRNWEEGRCLDCHARFLCGSKIKCEADYTEHYESYILNKLF